MKANLCTLLCTAALLSLGCYRSPMNKSQPRSPSSQADAGLAATPDARAELADLPWDLPRDYASDLPPDGAPDLSLEVPREAGAEVRDLGPDVRDLAADVRDLAADVRDLAADVRDLAADRTDLIADTRDLAGERSSDVVEVSPDLPARDLAVERSFEAGQDLGSEVQASICRPGENYILVLGLDDNLYRLYPDTLAMVHIGYVSCGTPGHALNSLTVSPRGPAYISNNYGELCVVDLDTFAPRETSFNAAAIANHQFGMAVLPDDVPAGQTLYAAVKDSGDTLARIDLTSYAITTVGPISIRRDGGTEDRVNVELTAGSNGELYGFAIGSTQSLLLTIDPTTGGAIDVSQVPAGANRAAFALVDWRGTLYLFLGNEDDTVGSFVYTYRKGDATVSSVGTLDVDLIGAGVALCH